MLLFPPAAPAQRHGAILSPCDHYSPVTTRNAELLSEGDRFQTRGCSALSLRHILPQTLPSKQARGLTLCSPFPRPGTATPARGAALVWEEPQRTRVAWPGTFYFVSFSILGLFSAETNRNHQRWGAVGEPNACPPWLGAGKILSAKQSSWGLTCGPYFLSQSLVCKLSYASRESLSHRHTQSCCTFLSVG